MKRPGYRHAVALVALNDDPSELDPDAVAHTITAALVADLFGTDTERVARDVVRFRKREAARRTPKKNRARKSA